MSTSTTACTIGDAILAAFVACPTEEELELIKGESEGNRKLIEQQYFGEATTKNDARVPYAGRFLVRVELDFDYPPPLDALPIFVSNDWHKTFSSEEQERIERRFGLQPVDDSRLRWIWRGCMPTHQMFPHYLYMGSMPAKGTFRLTAFGRQCTRRCRDTWDWSIEGIFAKLQQGQLPFATQVPTTLDDDIRWRADVNETAKKWEQGPVSRLELRDLLGKKDAAIKKLQKDVMELQTAMTDLLRKLKNT